MCGLRRMGPVIGNFQSEIGLYIEPTVTFPSTPLRMGISFLGRGNFPICLRWTMNLDFFRHCQSDIHNINQMPAGQMISRIIFQLYVCFTYVITRETSFMFNTHHASSKLIRLHRKQWREKKNTKNKERSKMSKLKERTQGPTKYPHTIQNIGPVSSVAAKLSCPIWCSLQCITSC